MTYLEAFEIIKMKLKQTSRATVIENVRVCGGTYDSWSRGEVESPSLRVFVKFCIYFGLEVSMAELKHMV